MMKKLLSFLLAAVIAGSLCACGGASNLAGTIPHVTDGGTDDVIQFYTVTARYDYGMHRPGLAAMLYDSGTLFFTLPEGFDPPVAGDVFTIAYTGDMLVAEIYPSVVTITGKIQSVSGQKAEILQVSYHAPADGTPERFAIPLGDGSEEEIAVISRPDYYIINEDGEFLPLSEVSDCITLYLTYSPVDGRTDQGITAAGLYAQNPHGSGSDA